MYLEYLINESAVINEIETNESDILAEFKKSFSTNTIYNKVYENLNDDEPFRLVKTIEDGIKMVQQQLPYHPDFIKIWYIANRDSLGVEASARKNLPVIKAIIEEAHKNLSLIHI